MIDSHCHLEAVSFKKDLDKVIEECKKELRAVITCCVRPDDFHLTMDLVDKYENFVFAACGIHPELIKEISEKDKDNYLELIAENKDKIVAIGEIGLDYFRVREPDWQRKQRELFSELITFAKNMGKPIIIHSREAFEDTLKIMERQFVKDAILHMWGNSHLVGRLLLNDWYLSTNAIVFGSKNHLRIARSYPLNRLILGSDSPQLSPERFLKDADVRNVPTSIKVVAQKIAEVKELSFEKAWKIFGENAVNAFKLPV